MPFRTVCFIAFSFAFFLLVPEARAAARQSLPAAHADGLPALDPAAALEPPVIQAARAVTQPRPTPPAQQDPWERDDTLGYVSLAISGVGFLTAAASLLLKRRHASAQDCRGLKCEPPSREEVTRDKALGTATAVGTLVGVAGGVAGAILLLSRKKGSKREGVSAVVQPSHFGIKARF